LRVFLIFFTGVVPPLVIQGFKPGFNADFGGFSGAK